MRSLLLGAIFLYILLLWAIGWVASKRSKGSESYLVADRRFSTPFVSALVAGTWIGGVSVVGMARWFSISSCQRGSLGSVHFHRMGKESPSVLGRCSSNRSHHQFLYVDGGQEEKAKLPALKGELPGKAVLFDRVPLNPTKKGGLRGTCRSIT